MSVFFRRRGIAKVTYKKYSLNYLWNKYNVNTTYVEHTGGRTYEAGEDYDSEFRHSFWGDDNDCVFTSINITQDKISFTGYDPDLTLENLFVKYRGQTAYGTSYNIYFNDENAWSGGQVGSGTYTKNKSEFYDSNYYWTSCPIPSNYTFYKVNDDSFYGVATGGEVPITLTYHWYTPSYSKGSTSHGTVTASSRGAYPTNGTSDNTYWYVYQGTVKGEEIGTIEALPGEYPEDGEQDGYWYVRQ